MSFDPTIVAGDLLCFVQEDKYNIVKVLKVDQNTETYHVLSYFPADHKPSEEEVAHLDVYVMHSPIGSLESGEKIGHIPVQEDDLQGFYYYLKITNFDRYCLETNQKLEDILAKANACFKAGYAYTDEKEYEEAINKYLEAVDLYPLFYEAIDNMAFVKMTLGRHSDAIDDFRWSLEIEPKSVLAEFSIGECYLKMGHHEEAKEQFEKALEMEPDNPLALDFLAKVNTLIEGQAASNDVLDEAASAAEDELSSQEENSAVEEKEEAEAEPSSLDDYLNTPIDEEPSDENPTPQKKKWWRFGR